MFSIEPFTAKRYSTIEGWQQCRAVGITENAGGAPVYIIEVYEDGESYLTTEEVLRRPAPTA